MVTSAATAAASRNDGSAKGSSAPAWLMTAVVLAAAIFAFSPRPAPPFAATQVQPDGLLVTGLARHGNRLLAAGEQGQILVADSPKGPWHSATVTPQRGSTFTQVAFLGEHLALAVGHDGWLVRSEDNGETWKEAAFNAELSDPLMGVSGPYDGKLYAYGAFGLLMTSVDQGKTWQKDTLAEAADPNAKPAAPAAEVDPNADPYANFQASGGGIADHHLNAMTRLADGALMLVGERGLMARSDDQGKTWKSLPEIYSGSFYGLIPTQGGGLLAYGMRGNAFYSSDSGKTWTKSTVPDTVSLFGATLTPRQEVVLVGENNSIFISTDGGRHFKLSSTGGHTRLATVVPLDSGDLLTAGEAGIRLREPGVNLGEGQK